MPGSTGAPWNLPHPAGTEQPFVHLDMKALAEAVAGHLGRAWPCTRDTRPPHQAGRLIFETDTEDILISDGAEWLWVAGLPPFAHIKRAAANHNIPSAVWSKAGLDTVIDAQGSTGTRPTVNAASAVVTLPVAGVYSVTARAQVTGARWDARLMLGATEVATDYAPAGARASDAVTTLATVVRATAAATLTIEVFPYAAASVVAAGSDLRVARIG